MHEKIALEPIPQVHGDVHGSPAAVLRPKVSFVCRISAAHGNIAYVLSVPFNHKPNYSYDELLYAFEELHDNFQKLISKNRTLKKKFDSLSIETISLKK